MPDSTNSDNDVVAKFRQVQGDLERAYQAHDEAARALPTWPIYDEARQRFVAFLEEMKEGADV